MSSRNARDHIGTADLVRSGYDQVAEAYAESRDRFSNVRYLHELAQQLKSPCTVLDLGCGSGFPVDRYLIDRGFSVIGLDISERQIALARLNVPEATFAMRDMMELKDREFTVDAVVGFYAIFHTPREFHADLFRRIRSFLMPDGLVLVTMGAQEAEGTEPDFHGVEMYWSHYGPETNRAMVEKAGFAVELDEIDERAGEKHRIILARAN